MSLQLTYVTSNDGKYNEAKLLLPGLERLSLDLVEIQSLDSHEIIAAKLSEAARCVADADNRILMVEDVSVVFEKTGGLPGPLVKHFGGLGAEGLYKFAKAFEAERMTFSVSVGLWEMNKAPMFFDGKMEGTVVSPRGAKKYLCDQIFVPEGQTQTYAEMTIEQKNAISHRAVALRKVREYLEQQKHLHV